ncbi:MAG: hypothetical protein HKN87_16550 [Saprospiraceae bacterium]|nr:hypothetical protein [Saprospiraceae bacterium]
MVRRSEALRNNTKKRLFIETILVLTGFALINIFLDWLLDIIALNPAHDDANLAELFTSLIISFFT